MKKVLKFFMIVVILMVVVGAGFFIFQFFQNSFTRAADTAPRSVAIADITENSASITWTTDRESQSVVEYGTAPDALTFFAPEGEKTTSHSVSLTLLTEATTYYFRIKVGDTSYYDNSGDNSVPWTFSTKGAATSAPAPNSQSQEPSVYTSCLNETDCDVIKEKIKTQECLAIHYSKCLQSKTE